MPVTSCSVHAFGTISVRCASICKLTPQRDDRYRDATTDTIATENAVKQLAEFSVNWKNDSDSMTYSFGPSVLDHVILGYTESLILPSDESWCLSLGLQPQPYTTIMVSASFGRTYCASFGLLERETPTFSESVNDI
jgi:hypothetical protein